MTTEISSTKVAGGTLRRIKHPSVSTKTDMTFALFTPAATVAGWSNVVHFTTSTAVDNGV